MNSLGGLAIGVPGEIQGYYTAWKNFGRVRWADLFTPTIRLCERGHRITASTATAISDKEEDIRDDPYLR